MAQITKRIDSSQLNNYPIVDGQTIFVTDRNLFYQDIGKRRFAVVSTKKVEKLVNGSINPSLILNQLLLQEDGGSYSLSFIDDEENIHILASGEEFDPSVFDKKLYIKYFKKDGTPQDGYVDNDTVYAGFALSLEKPIDNNKYEKININPDIDAGGW